MSWMKKLGEILQRIIDELRGKKPKPEPVPEPVPEPEPVNKGGDGLYKPESRLWLLPSGIRAPMVYQAYEVAGDIRRYLRLGENTGPHATGDQWPVIDNPAYYHNDRLKMRDAKVTRDGARLEAIDRTGKVLAAMTVEQRDVRQEGRTRL